MKLKTMEETELSEKFNKHIWYIRLRTVIDVVKIESKGYRNTTLNVKKVFFTMQLRRI